MRYLSESTTGPIRLSYTLSELSSDQRSGQETESHLDLGQDVGEQQTWGTVAQLAQLSPSGLHVLLAHSASAS